MTAAGAVASDPEALHEKEVEKEDIDPADRERVLMECFEGMVEANRRDDFSANGIPTAKAIKKITGLDVDPKELGLLWAKFKQKK